MQSSSPSRATPLVAVARSGNVRHVSASLGQHGFAVRLEERPGDALLALRSPARAVLIELTAADDENWPLVRLMREQRLVEAILCVSDGLPPESRVQALESGADDFVESSIASAELAARIRVVLRAVQAVPIIHASGMRIDPYRRTAEVAGSRLQLTPHEFDLLRLLAENGRPLCRDAIFLAVWGERARPESKVVEVLVSRLRKKLIGATIEYRCGKGYVLESDERRQS